MKKTITIAGERFVYNNKEELLEILKKMEANEDFRVGDLFRGDLPAGESFLFPDDYLKHSEYRLLFRRTCR